MNQIEEIEALELYGIREESNLPIPILEKMYNMDKKNCEDFKSKIQEITEEILFIKTGELNELNRCHVEIEFGVTKLQIGRASCRERV